MAEQRDEPGVELMAGLAGLAFAAGAFARGSILALAGALVLVRRQTPRTRRALLWALVGGTTLAACQAQLRPTRARVPSNRLVEQGVVSGTPVYMLSGGWEASNHQRWPDNGPWRTTVVARGTYRARRAEVVEGAMPELLTEWGGSWELHRIDCSIWRGHGALSLYRGSRFIEVADEQQLRTVEIDLRWEPRANVELHTKARALDGCMVSVELRGGDTRMLLPSRPGSSATVHRFAMPDPPATSRKAAVSVQWSCREPRPVDWRRLSMRWERPKG